ncbi:glycosyltransferase family 25 protein [Tabrizicola sp.]|uniref:glycosyltransferase family 25 protein n=1 Tax=Tabrizicola sp. TaxID=2005166 RepID=UPI003F41506E
MPPPPRIELRVLTMANATERHARMRATIAAAPSVAALPWDFFHAVQHDEIGLAYDDPTAVLHRGRTLSAPELSCYASHVAIWRAFLASDSADYLLVCEDDVYIDPSFDMATAARLMATTGIDYLRLYGRAIVPARLLLYWTRFQLLRFPWSPGGTQCYMLSRTGAQRLVDHVAALPGILRPIDNEMDRSFATRLPVYALHPWPVLEHNAATTIHADHQVRERQEIQRALERARPQTLVFRVGSRLDRLSERLARRRQDRALAKQDAEIAQRALALFASPGFKRFQADQAPSLPGENASERRAAS